MKEVALFSDVAKSKESAKQLMQVNRFPFSPLKFFLWELNNPYNI